MDRSRGTPPAASGPGPGSGGPSDLLLDQRPVRLNRYLAAAGLASRRGVERLIEARRVTVNGTVVERPGTHVLPGRDRVMVDGRRVELRSRAVYILLYKPRGVVSTVADDRGRRTVLDCVADVAGGERLFPVGRLDLDSEGLVLLTNDGTLTHRLLHPRYHVAKRYRVWTTPAAPATALAALARGIEIEPGIVTRPATVAPRRDRSFVIELREGRKRQIRLMCEAVGLEVTRLVRIALGPLRLGRLRPGSHRALDHREIAALWRAAGLLRRLPGGGSGSG
ncbi:MAG: pseudouridine synthase [Candidatus Eiseniibacteriota bacterium]|jgi:pseudouridine synthase